MVSSQAFLVFLHVPLSKSVSENPEVLHEFWPFPFLLSAPHLPLSFLGQVLYSTQQCFSNLWHCRKILFEAGFSFSTFRNICISVIFFFLSRCPVLSAFLTDFQWTFSDFLTLRAFRQWFAGKVSLPILSSSIFYGITTSLLNCECAGRGSPGRRRYDGQRWGSCPIQSPESGQTAF